MKVLITGGAGFIGLHLANSLLKNHHKVDLLDNFSRGKLDDELNLLSQNSQMSIINADLQENNLINQLDTDYDLIFHFAAMLGVQNVLDQPYKVLDLNMLLTSNAISIAKQQKSLDCFIFSSTSEVYAGSLENNLLDIPTKESSLIVLPERQKPRTSYMLSKLYGEAMCIHSSIPYLIMRPHNIYGPRMGMSHVIPQLIEKAYKETNNGMLNVYSLEHTRTFCYVEDAVEQMYALILNKKSRNQIYNIGCQFPEITIEELSNKIVKLIGKKLFLNSLGTSEGSPSRRCPDMSNTNSMINYANKISIDEGLRLTYNWYIKNYFKK
jgi:nucleoside-diphosphate-sugar epimerase